MGRLIYTAQASLDGRVADEHGDFDFAEPDEAVHAFVNDLERPTGTYLYGRAMYEVMSYWEDPPADSPEVEQDYGRIWRAADKVVYSASLDAVATERTRLERAFDPDGVRALKRDVDHDLSIGGARLAAAALRAHLVDEVRLFLTPHLVGSGPRALPDGATGALRLLDEHRFDSGTVYLRHAVEHRS